MARYGGNGGGSKDRAAGRAAESGQYGAYSDRSDDPEPVGECELCGRRVRREALTRHHLVPRSRARKLKRRKKRRRELRDGRNGRNLRELEKTVDLCRPCHRNVHASVSNHDLERGYDSVEALREHPGVRRFTDWVRKKRPGNY